MQPRRCCECHWHWAWGQNDSHLALTMTFDWNGEINQLEMAAGWKLAKSIAKKETKENILNRFVGSFCPMKASALCSSVLILWIFPINKFDFVSIVKVLQHSLAVTFTKTKLTKILENRKNCLQMVPYTVPNWIKTNRTNRRTRRNSIILIACKFKYLRYSMSMR